MYLKPLKGKNENYSQLDEIQTKFVLWRNANSVLFLINFLFEFPVIFESTVKRTIVAFYLIERPLKMPKCDY